MLQPFRCPHVYGYERREWGRRSETDKKSERKKSTMELGESAGMSVG